MAPHARDQPNSPLFRLPLELRETIWEYALAVSDIDAQESETAPLTRVHFHVFDKLVDCCSYERRYAEEHRRRKLALQTALLRTCWAVYHESVQLLYNTTHFDLVLLNGHPRPDGIYDEVSGKWLSRLRTLGKLENCTPLRRMRSVTVTVQPGKWPDIAAYEKRIATFLRSIDHGRQLKNLTIRFNFNVLTDWDTTAALIVRGFIPLGATINEKCTTVLCPVRLIRTVPAFNTAVDELRDALRVRQTNVRFRDWGAMSSSQPLTAF